MKTIAKPSKQRYKRWWAIFLFVIIGLILCYIIEPLRIILAIPFTLGLILLWSLPIILFILIIIALVKYIWGRK